MRIPVLWVSLHEDILARGYADQALLEDVMSRRTWRPPGAYEFDHREVRSLDELGTEGAVVVLPGRHHADDVEELCEALYEMAWCVLLITSEEEWVFNWRRVMDYVDALWFWQPRPEHVGSGWLMPCGYYTDTVDAARAATEPGQDKPLDWFFGGQVTHVRREECVEALRKLDRPGDSILTEAYYTGIPFRDYIAREAQAKVIPCPSGPESVCTARVEEALELGAVPVVDLVKPRDPQFDYWRTTFGEDCPLRGITDWADFPGVLDQELREWPRNAVRLSSWWQQWKRRTAHRLDDDIRAASGLEDERVLPDDRVTVIVPTSPVPSHPSTDDLVETIESVRAQLPDAEIVIVADGVRPEQYGQLDDYYEYLRRVCWLTAHEWHNVVPLVLPEWGHQANATRAALELVTTPEVLFVEHDTPLMGEIDWAGLCSFVESGAANCVRLHIDVAIHPDHEAGMLDHDTLWGLNDGSWVDRHEGRPESAWQPVPVRRTKTWWQRPHLASARFYREKVMPHFSPESRTMIEDRLYGIVSTEHMVHGDAAWWDWRLWVYTPELEGDVLGMKRSGHLDSRGEQPKFDMRFE